VLVCCCAAAAWNALSGPLRCDQQTRIVVDGYIQRLGHMEHMSDHLRSRNEGSLHNPTRRAAVSCS
jgi:hypothetical protein